MPKSMRCLRVMDSRPSIDSASPAFDRKPRTILTVWSADTVFFEAVKVGGVGGASKTRKQVRQSPVVMAALTRRPKGVSLGETTKEGERIWEMSWPRTLPGREGAVSVRPA